MELSSLLPPRSVEDILFERVRLVIGGEVYDLPALVIEENERWKAEMDAELSGLLGALSDAGDDVGALVPILTQDPGRLLGLLRSYDVTGVLPDDATIQKSVTPMTLLRSVLEVWRAANPLVDIGLLGVTISAPPPNTPPKPMSSPRRNGAGRRAKSGAS